MPDRPETWMAIWATVTGLSATVEGAGMAVLISVLRVIYDGEKTDRTRVLLEALMCGSLSLCAAGIIRWIGLPDDVAIAVGGSVGFIGVQKIREYAFRWMDKLVK